MLTGSFDRALLKFMVDATICLLDKSEFEKEIASVSERNSEPRGNGAAALRQAVE